MRILSIIFLGIILSSFIPEQGKGTKVKIIIISEENMLVEGATVTLYGNHDDYKNEENPVVTAVTNEKGYVQFKGLKEKVYFIHAEKGHHNNHTGHIKTAKLSPKGKNRFEIMIN